MTTAQHITSRDNALVKRLRLLARDTTAYRKLGQVWLEGEHLCQALLSRGLQPTVVVFSEEKWHLSLDGIDYSAINLVSLPASLMADLSGLESPAGVGFVFDLPQVQVLDPVAPTLVLDRVQDAGNVGSMIRSAAAFGYSQVLAIKGTAALWSPKVLRAGMGAHFALRLLEGVAEDDLAALHSPLLITSSHGGQPLHRASLPWPCAWVMGHEGQGVSPTLASKAQQGICIPQPGGEESLNVAAAAAICLYASTPKD